MSFNKKEAENLLVLCKRCCCICHTFCGIHMELHHIVPKSDGGSDDIKNAIPLCFTCHSEVHLDGKYPKSRKYSFDELRKHKSQWIENSKDLDIKEIEKIKNEILAYLDSFKINEIYNTVMGMSVQLEDLMNLKKIVSKQSEMQNKTNVKLIDDPDYYFKLGNIELEYGNYSEARNYFNSAIDLGMKNSSLNFNLFKAEANLGNFSEAFYRYEQAINSNSKLQLIPSRYRILEILGEGSTAMVYKGCDTENQHTVIIKIFKGNITKDYKNLEQIQKQFELLKSLDSQYIIKYLEDGFFAGRKFVIYNFIEGQTLREAIDNGSLTKNEKKKIIIGLCEATLFLHEKSLLHLDIKPSNILLRKEDGLPVFSDFGSILHIDSLTHTNVSFTWAYAAPELTAYSSSQKSISSSPKRERILGLSLLSRKDMNLSFSYDVYSLGVTIAELLTGNILKIRYEYKKIREEYSQDLEKLIINMTSPESSKRLNMSSVLSRFKELFNAKD